MTEVTHSGAAGLSREEMDAARERLPILYVDAVPVRVDEQGVVTAVGLLLRIPPAPQPFTIAEYFPTPGVTPFHDPRQHAVSLAYVVPVEGDCAPQQDALAHLAV